MSEDIKILLARDLIEVAGTEEAYMSLIAQMAEGVNITDNKRDVICDVVKDNSKAMLDVIIDIYANAYTAEELYGAITFFKSDIGQSYQSKTADVAMVIMNRIGEFSENVLMPAVENALEGIDV